MERIVSGIAKINFLQNCEDILSENRTENMSAMTHELAGATNAIDEEKPYKNCTTDSDLDSDFNSSSETAICGEDDADSSYSESSSSTCGTFSQRRNLPRRACKENSLKVKRRSITKPKRHTSRSCDFSMLRPAEVKKIYCNQKLTSFRPTNLETIFEEPQPAASRSDAAIATANTSLRFIGLRKIRRSISCSDGLNTTKTLIKQRRAKIKKIFGRRSVCKKISLSDFIDRLNKSFGDEADIEDAGVETDDNNAQAEEPMEEADTEMNTTDDNNGDSSSVTENAQNYHRTIGGGITTTATNKTEFEMILGTGNEHNNGKKVEKGSLFYLPNAFGTLAYSRDAVDAANLSNVTDNSNLLAGGIH